VLAVAACGGAAKPPPSGPAVPAYLALFERGRGWSLPIVTVNGEHRGEAWVATTTERGTLKCDVADVKPVGDANVSRVQCAPPYSGLLARRRLVGGDAGGPLSPGATGRRSRSPLRPLHCSATRTY